MADAKVCDVCGLLITDPTYYQVPEANLIETATMTGYEPKDGRAKDVHKACMTTKSVDVCNLIKINVDAVYTSK